MHLWDRVDDGWGGVGVLAPLYWNIFLRGLGMSMLGLFVPIYIYSIGASGAGLAAGLRLIAWYMLIQRFLMAVMTVGVAKLIGKIGFRWGVLLGSSLTVVYYFLPSVLSASFGLVAIMAVLTAFSIPFYWISRLSVLAIDGEYKSFGRETGIVTFLERGGAVLSPLAGGVIAQVLGFKMLFTVGTVIVFLSTIPLFFMKHHRRDGEVSWRGFKRWLTDKNKRHLLISFVGEGWDGFVTSYYWPLFIFLAVGSMEVLGGISSITMLFSIVMVFFASRWFDKKRAVGGSEDERMFWRANGLLALVRFLRAGFGSLAGLFSIDLVTKLTSPFYWIPFGGYMYSAGKKDKSPRFYAYREMVYSLAIVIACGLVILMVGREWRWWGVFGFSAVGVLLTMMMAKES